LAGAEGIEPSAYGFGVAIEGAADSQIIEAFQRFRAIHLLPDSPFDALLMLSQNLPRISQRTARQEANAGRIFSTGRPRRCAFSRSYVTRVSSSMNARSLSLALAQLTLYFLHILKNIS
jgi:hypothetical protein